MRSIAKHSYLKGRLAKVKGIAHTHYIQTRSGKDKDLNDGRPRRFFDAKSDDVEGDAVRRHIAEQEGVIVMHKLILSPGMNDVEMRDYTRELLGEFGQGKGLDLDWYGVIHENTDHQHAHVVIMGRDKNDREVRLRKPDYEELRYLGDRYLEKYHTYERFVDRDLEKILDGDYARDLGDEYYERLLKDLKSDKSFEELATERKEEKDREREEDEGKYKNRKQLEESGELDRLRKQFDDDLRRSLREDRGVEPRKGRKQWIIESKGRLLESHERFEISIARFRLKSEMSNLSDSEADSARLKEIQEQLDWINDLVQEDFGSNNKEKDLDVNVELEQEEKEREEAEDSKLQKELAEDRKANEEKSDREQKPQVQAKTSEAKEKSDDDNKHADADSSDGADRDSEEAREAEERKQEDKERVEREDAERRETEDREQRDKEDRDKLDQEERDRQEQEERARDDEDRERQVQERERDDQIKREEQAAREESEKLFRMQMEADRLREQQIEVDRETGNTPGRSRLDEKIDKYTQEIEQAKDGIDYRYTKVDDIQARDFDLDRDVEQNWDLGQKDQKVQKDHKLGDDKEFESLELDLDDLDRDALENERDAESELAEDPTTEMFGDDVKGLLADYEKLPEEERVAAWEKDAFNLEIIRGDQERENELDDSERDLLGDPEKLLTEAMKQDIAEISMQQQLQQSILTEIQREFFAPSNHDERDVSESSKEREDDTGDRER